MHEGFGTMSKDFPVSSCSVPVSWALSYAAMLLSTSFWEILGCLHLPRHSSLGLPFQGLSLRLTPKGSLVSEMSFIKAVKSLTVTADSGAQLRK